jgi:hypothetical protein
MKNELPSIYLTPPMSMAGGEFMSVRYNSDHRGYYTAAENVGRHAKLSCAPPKKGNLMMCATVRFFILHMWMEFWV